MQEMEVELINAIKYITKDDRKRTLIHFRIIDDKAVSYSDKFNGYAILDGYFDGHDVFDKIPHNYYGSKVKMYLEKRPNPTDPRRETTKITKINDITLV